GRILELVGKARRVDEELLRHAAADHAGPADAIFLGDRHLGAVRGGDARRAHPARARADDEEVDLRRDRNRHSLKPFFCISARKRCSTTSENWLAQSCASLRLSLMAIGSCATIFLPTGVL